MKILFHRSTSGWREFLFHIERKDQAESELCPSRSRPKDRDPHPVNSLPKEIAFLQLGPGHVVVGQGPFVGLARPPESRSAFYWNDFELTDPLPWKIPAACSVSPDLGQWASEPPPSVRWRSPALERFTEAFHSVSHGFKNGAQQEKLVPVVTEAGTLKTGDLRTLAPRAIAQAGSHSHAYGRWDADTGMVGITPERFLTVENGRLETMALAGTSVPGDVEAFKKDPKQIREHAIVVEGIRAALGGGVRAHPRQVLELDGLLHFLTRLCKELLLPVDLNGLIHRLHPTPAVGYSPRSARIAALSDQLRAQLAPPASFAAPFGWWHEGVFRSVVAIRHVSWSKEKVSLPTGCGLIRESELELEWKELDLKRRVVKELLDL